jgi:hypothetical protein
MSRALDIAYKLLHKTAGAAGAVVKGVHGVNRVGGFLSKQLSEAGVTSETAHAAAKLLPWYGVYRAGKAVKESEPVQRGLAKIRELRGGSHEYEG